MEFTHFNQSGRAKMVDVSEKKNTQRIAVAKGKIYMDKKTLEKVKEGSMKKGDVLSVAQVGGILGGKKTWDLIPMCHNIMISGLDIDFQINGDENYIEATCTAKTVGATGVEMEALTGVSIALLTIYDMCKAVDKKMVIRDIRLVEKRGGKSDIILE
ncbi:cyclic pyranopterin phosphate synthase [Anaerobranca californiensis DSM 14826]|uniref:Cyclic pyranopterin monophosphate synthase n=1 Tax=Anaerobranca californiensis DSM 14826 TaxID=1120989 RepID=A0A1M6M742_9FIRM|nr:cyclic pyranopterin monophosphate synthase MoaC [Anaerobranca californiensis]SHJ79247.1 cyclic pyranopterin phosphate synthase [Anaerobranca californiensis DSM 14826]